MISIAKPLIGGEEIDEVVKVLKSGLIAQGPKVAEFEERFAEYVNVEHGVATSSGTTALHLALLAADLKKGDEVITTPFTFAATANSILHVDARPVFVDIEPQTYNLDPQKIEEALTEKTRALMPVHLYGQPADMDAISQIAEDHDLKVIEDAAQAHGAIYHDQMVGSLGDAACFSFYPTKNITTSEGGMITTDSSEIDEEARILRTHGESQRYNHVKLGYNFRMTDIAAAIGLVQLRKLDYFNRKRIENAQYLTDHIKNIKGIKPPYVMKDVRHVFHQYTIRVENGKRDELMKFLGKKGIETAIHYPKAIYQHKIYHDMGFKVKCPEAEKAAEEVLSLPVHPGLDHQDLKDITEAIQEAEGKII